MKKVAKYNTLQGYFHIAGVTQAKVAEFMGFNADHFSRKMTGKVPFKDDEMWKIKNNYFPEISLDILFKPYEPPTKIKVVI